MNRYDMYRRPHKGLRALMADTLVAVGRADPADDVEMREACERAEALLASLEKHAKHENEHILRAIDGRSEGAACRWALEHESHFEAIESLRALVARRDPGLYRLLAVFVADNLRHMEEEENEANALLWSLFTDAELRAIEAGLIRALAPGDAMHSMRWMLSAMNHGERVAMLSGLPPGPVLEGALAIAQSNLEPADFARLRGAMAQREPATLDS